MVTQISLDSHWPYWRFNWGCSRVQIITYAWGLKLGWQCEEWKFQAGLAAGHSFIGRLGARLRDAVE